MITNIKTSDSFYDSIWMTKITWEANGSSNEINIPTKNSRGFMKQLINLQNNPKGKIIKYIRSKR